MFRCRSTDNSGPDEWTDIDAFDAECAACEFAERWDADSGEYPDRQVVTMDGHGEWTVYGEVSRTYSANRNSDAIEEGASDAQPNKGSSNND